MKSNIDRCAWGDAGNIQGDLEGRGPFGAFVDALTAAKFGFVVEPVVGLMGSVDGKQDDLYLECLARVITGDSVLLTGGDLSAGFEGHGEAELLDLSVLGLVLEELSEHPTEVLGCNVSPDTLANEFAWNAYLQAISKAKKIAGRLVLEMTESRALGTIPDASMRLRQARSLGCRLALDDFGSGFANSENLKDLDIRWDVVKIDRGWNVTDSASIAEDLGSLVEEARLFGEVLVVEGIETEEHRSIARDCGAEYGQGWLFAPAKVRRTRVLFPNFERRLMLMMPTFKGGADTNRDAVLGV